MSVQIPPKALFFDVFGTVVDWRTSIHRALTTSIQSILHDANRTIPSQLRDRAASITEKDWHAFAQAWRNEYYESTDSDNLDKNRTLFVTVDEYHLQSLRQLLEEWELDGLLTEDEIQKLSLAWHDLAPWPDSVEGLTRLNTKFITSTLSNGNTSLLKDLNTNGFLPFKHVTGAEDFGVYKPAPAVYQGAARKLGLETSECALVAAHMSDLAAARKCGFQTIYIERLNEETLGTEEVAKAKKEGWVDLWVSENQDGIRDVAAHFGLMHYDLQILGEA
ncbi:haloacid dehalogenase, type II [Talaromyces stipitatus ATCC 10500]|uniref:Haloacid dehalogenase, type II n=1 Tax=Talaromyces stipitatus (strain ATCC 10500 / CBS 375.48 / QM 6759 / NRRL 1006) TaxID=441959 RepID=B8M677_TALSN|nr:haloacid dehalogenase, type II [Talaromyces stipitatus ATCC 10500]EED19077.1 haloacid dehalogenase, type II [Talaromyces stipitatus ATCC 10500]